MLYVRPPSLDEIDKLENEVFKELDGVESSFTTQRKVFQHLIQDFERSNASLQREQKLYQKTADRLSEMEVDIENLNNEIKQLHQLVIFLGNQLNRRISLGSTLSSTSTQDESLTLDEMMKDLLHVSSPKLQKQLERSEMNKVSISPQPKVTSRSTNTSVDASNNELIATLTENLMLKDKLIEHLEEKIAVQSVEIRNNHDGKLYSETTITHLLNIIQQSTSHCSVFAAKLFDNVHTSSRKSNASETPKSYHLLNIKDQLVAVRKEEHSRFPSGTSHRLYPVENKSCRAPQRNILVNNGRRNDVDDDNDDGDDDGNNNSNIADIHLQSTEANHIIDRGIDPCTLAPWDRFNNGIASRMIGQMGYVGGGLGKRGNGIVTPIEPSNFPCPCSTHRNGIGSPPRVKNVIDPWRRDTTLIVGDSILHGVDETKLTRYFAKVRAFSGARIDDIYDYLKPLLAKQPTVILHVGTNDAHVKTPNEMLNELIHLKEYVQTILPDSNVFISTPTLRLDDNKANVSLRELSKKLKDSVSNIVENGNILSEGIGKKGLHLNEKGSGRLALNYINLMKRL